MKDLTVGKESKTILLFALPMLLGNLFQQSYNLIDSAIVGNYIGTEALAAVGASFPVLFVLISLVIGVSIGATIVISQYYGANDIKNVKRAIDTIFITIFFASIFITIISFVFSKEIFDLLKLPPEVVPQAILYFKIFASGLILLFGLNAVNAILRGLGDSKTPLYFMIISTFLNIVLDLFFVIVLKMGIEGVAYATVLAQGIAFIIAVIYLNKYHSIIRISFKNLTFDKDIFLKSVKIGVPTGLQQTFVALGMMALIRIVNDFGTITLAAYTVAGRINSLAAMPAMDFSVALTAFVGQNIGANKIHRVKKAYKATLGMTSIISIVVTATVLLLGKQIMGLFTSDAEVIEIGVSYFYIVGGFYIVFSSMFITQGVLRGAGDTLIPMFFTLISLWLLRIPFSYYLSREDVGLGSDGIWWGIPIAWVVGFVLSYIYYLTGKWKKKVIIKR